MISYLAESLLPFRSRQLFILCCSELVFRVGFAYHVHSENWLLSIDFHPLALCCGHMLDCCLILCCVFLNFYPFENYRIYWTIQLYICSYTEYVKKLCSLDVLDYNSLPVSTLAMLCWLQHIWKAPYWERMLYGIRPVSYCHCNASYFFLPFRRWDTRSKSAESLWKIHPSYK